MDIKRRFAGAAAVLLACIAALLFAVLVPARAISPSGGRRYRGIDISEFQGEVDFGKVRRSGIEAVYIRAGAGEYADEYFAENYSRAREAGLRVGFYHYVTARSVEEGRRQARFFASLAAGRRLDMRLAMDFEYFGSLTAEQVNAIAEAYLDELTRVTKKEAVIYSDLSNARSVFGRRLAEKYPLWAAQYGADEPSPNGKWRAPAFFSAGTSMLSVKSYPLFRIFPYIYTVILYYDCYCPTRGVFCEQMGTGFNCSLFFGQLFYQYMHRPHQNRHLLLCLKILSPVFRRIRILPFSLRHTEYAAGHNAAFRQPLLPLLPVRNKSPQRTQI